MLPQPQQADVHKVIIELLRQRGSRLLPVAAIHEQLGGEATLEQVQRAVDELESEGIVLPMRGKRYSLLEFTPYHAGRIKVHPDGYGTIFGGKNDPDIYIDRRSMKGAMNGDLVVVSVDKRNPKYRKLHGRDLIIGEVNRVLRRAHRTVVGRFHDSEVQSFVVPYDFRIDTDIVIDSEEDTMHALDGEMVNVELDRYPDRSTHLAHGRIVERLGFIGDPGVDIEVVIRKYHIPHEFEPEVLREAESVPTEVAPEELARRVDLRERSIVTIDGETAKDFDDAVEVRQLPNGNFMLGVHIADVAHYVTEASVLDREAFERGTSVYFPGRAVPMLPERLSNGICSLNPRVERLTFSVDIEIDRRGRFVDHKVYKSVIRTKERMTYTNVNAIFIGLGLAEPAMLPLRSAQRSEAEAASGHEPGVAADFSPRESVESPSAPFIPAPHGVRVPPFEELREKYGYLFDEFRRMHEVYEILRARRDQRGSIDFDLPEAEVMLDPAGDIEAIRASERNVAHRLIEEFMLAANEMIAQTLVFASQPGLYRVHQQPDPQKLEDLKEILKEFKLTLRGDPEEIRPGELQRVMKAVAGTPEERFLTNIILRSMKRAFYSDESLGHFALALQNYCHFTSPIRRYPDLIVHRRLAELIERGPAIGERLAKLEAAHPQYALQSSEREKRAEDAEREVLEWKKVIFMRERVGEPYSGIITGVAPFGIFVELDEIFVQGMVPIATIGGDYWNFAEREHRLRGQSSARELRLGDHVRVEVKSIDEDRHQIEFRLLEVAGSPIARRER